MSKDDDENRNLIIKKVKVFWCWSDCVQKKSSSWTESFIHKTNRNEFDKFVALIKAIKRNMKNVEINYGNNQSKIDPISRWSIHLESSEGWKINFYGTWQLFYSPLEDFVETQKNPFMNFKVASHTVCELERI